MLPTVNLQAIEFNVSLSMNNADIRKGEKYILNITQAAHGEFCPTNLSVSDTDPVLLMFVGSNLTSVVVRIF